MSVEEMAANFDITTDERRTRAQASSRSCRSGDVSGPDQSSLIIPADPVTEEPHQDVRDLLVEEELRSG